MSKFLKQIKQFAAVIQFERDILKLVENPLNLKSHRIQLVDLNLRCVDILKFRLWNEFLNHYCCSRVISLAKRAGARSFGPRFRDFESYFYPNTKRHETFSPYYYYQQPKRAGARAFYSYWNPPADREGR